VPHDTWDGEDDIGSFDDGRAGRCTNYSVDSTCVQIEWPAPYYGAFLDDVNRTLRLPKAWFGSLTSDRRDPSGQIYLRNRYYDPETGREAWGPQDRDNTLAVAYDKPLVDDDKSCAKYLESFDRTTQRINKAKIGYHTFSANSNSVANTLLVMSGIRHPSLRWGAIAGDVVLSP